MVRPPAEARLPLDGGDFDPPELPVRAKTLIPPGHARWIDEGGSWRATIGRWSVRVICRAGASPTWEWQAFSAEGTGPRAVGGRSWQAREAAQRDAEKTLANLS